MTATTTNLGGQAKMTVSHFIQLITADDVMSDVNFQSNNLLNNFLLITKTTEHGDVEVKQRDVRSSLYSA